MKSLSIVVLVSLGVGRMHPAYARRLFINELIGANSSAIADPDYHDYAD